MVVTVTGTDGTWAQEFNAGRTIVTLCMRSLRTEGELENRLAVCPISK